MDGAMALQTVMIGVTLAVKNGPLSMWRSLDPAGPIKPLDRFVTSPLWLAATICVYLALAPSVYHATRSKTVSPNMSLLFTTAALGLFVVFDVLVHGTALPLLVFVLLVATRVAVALRAGLRQTRQDKRHTAEVVDLARWREDRRARRRAGSR
jgi:multisubunit Na+/H+ antiporter MnhG subunit